MNGPTGRRLLAVAYLVPVTGAVVALVVLGSLLDRLPVPASLRRRYETGLFAAVGALTRPADALGCRPTDRRPVEAELATHN